MIDFSNIWDKSILGKALRSALGRVVRLFFCLIPRGLQLPILQGPLRGWFWIVGAEEEVHVCLLGYYDLENQERLMRAVRPGQVFLDIGAHVGFYTLLASKLCGDRGQVIAFEPVARNLKYLKKHIEINRRSNINVIESAVGDDSGSASFDPGRTTYSGSISPGGSTVVPIARLDDLYEQGAIPSPDVIKMNIEGAEFMAILGGRRLISECKPVIFLSTHGAETHSRCVNFLKGLGYGVQPVSNRPNKIIAVPNQDEKGEYP